MQEELKVMNDLQLGDLTITDDQSLGFSISKGDEKKAWVNQNGEETLLEWLAEKHGKILSVNDEDRQPA